MNHRLPEDLEPRDQETLYIIPFVNWAIHTADADEAEMWSDLGYDVVRVRPYDMYRAMLDSDAESMVWL